MSQSVLLSLFGENDTDVFCTFKEETTRSVALANVLDATKLDSLKLQVSGRALLIIWIWYLRPKTHLAMPSGPWKQDSPYCIEFSKLKIKEHNFNQSQ